MRSAWMARAACRGMPPARFYPPSGAATAAALAVCAGCPVRVECDQHADATGEEYGIWGGRPEIDRARAPSPQPVTLGRRSPGPPPALDDDHLIDLVRSLDPDEPAAPQLLDRLRVSVPTAYKYLHRARRLGVVERRGRHIYPSW
jgi:WhiB family redox-sensing transcriptional regulator